MDQFGNHEANFFSVLPPDLPHQRPCAFSSEPPHIEDHAVTTSMEWSGPNSTQHRLIRLRRLGRQPRSVPRRTRHHRPWGPYRMKLL